MRRDEEDSWAFRQRTEREAADRFTRLERQLRESGAATVVVELAAKAILDERRHAVLCASVAAAYGRAECPTVRAAPEVGPRSFAPRDRLLYEIVAFCCVTESINAALLTATYETATAPRIRDAVREILEDEVDHARLGWAHLATERAQGRGGFLPALLPAMLRGTVDEELLATTDTSEGDPQLLVHGNLTMGGKRELFRAGLRDVILPGFDSLGVDTGLARRWYEAALLEAPRYL